MKYAERTRVPVEKSRDEIERTLCRFGASQFLYGWDTDGPDEEVAIIGFRMADRQIRIRLPIPAKKIDSWEQRNVQAAQAGAYEQTRRQRWRALLLIIKAKLEGVESGIATLEEAFLSDVVLPNKETVGQWLRPQLDQAYLTGSVPPLLLTGRSES